MRKINKNQIGMNFILSKEHHMTVKNIYNVLFDRGAKQKQDYKTNLLEFAIEHIANHLDEFQKYLEDSGKDENRTFPIKDTQELKKLLSVK